MAIGGRAHPQIKWPDCRVVLEPTSSPMITKGHSGNHRVEGVSVGFAPPLLDQQLYDEAHTIPKQTLVPCVGVWPRRRGYWLELRAVSTLLRPFNLQRIGLYGGTASWERLTLCKCTRLTQHPLFKFDLDY